MFIVVLTKRDRDSLLALGFTLIYEDLQSAPTRYVFASRADVDLPIDKIQFYLTNTLTF